MKLREMVLFVCVILFITTSLPGEQEKKLHYYRVDKVKTITGKITAVKTEKSYHRNDFTVIYLKEKKSGEIYRVEVAPQWFYSLDLMIGSRIQVTGSFARNNGINMIMTRSITFLGERFQFRNKMGFPMWRGQQKRGRTNRKQPNKAKHRGAH
jgi:hypothetical protein